MKFFALLPFALFCALSSMAQKRFINSNYYVDYRSEYVMAITNFIGIDAPMADSALNAALSSGWRQLRLLPSKQVHSISAHNATVKMLIDRIRSTNYSNDETRKFPSLDRILSPEEMDMLSRALGGAHFLLVPFNLNLYSTDPGAAQALTNGTIDVKLYDLTNGTFVFLFREELHTRTGGKEGKVKCISDLTNQFARFFQKHFIEEQRID